jgi:4-amino-4-deoxy-L-arabinose transferase-like glycosyltransferase
MKATAHQSKKWESPLPAAIIIFLATAARFFILKNYHPIWWDSAVYSGMGKFIFSLGTSGIWEPLRPPVLPIILGFFWKIGIYGNYFSGILSMMFSAGTILLVYLISKKIFGYKTAVVACFFSAFGHLMLFYDHAALSEIPAIFFGLLAVYLIIEKKYFWAGIFSSFSFLTKFPSGIIFGGAIIFIAFFQQEKIREKAKRIFLSSAGFLIPSAIFLIANFMMYGNALLPFIEGNMVIANTFPKSPVWFYIARITIECIISVFAVVYLVLLALKKEKNRNSALLWIPLALFLAYFSLLAYKEMRFAILLMPFVYMLSAEGVLKALKKPKIIILVLLIFSIQSAFMFSLYQNNWEIREPNPAFENFYRTIKGKTGEIWVSNPVFSEYTDGRLNLIYYPTFEKSAAAMPERMKNASHVFISTCDISCITEECKKRNSEIMASLEGSFTKKEWNSSPCRLLVFSR